MILRGLAAAILLASGCAAAAPTSGPAVAVELFTSQGCSSCPPADALLARLAADPRLVVVTRPVTYWDRLGWKDTLARPANTELQQHYARSGIAGGGVYTPQIVVNGAAGAVGGREDRVRALIGAAKPQAGSLVVTPRYGGRQVVVHAPDSAELVLLRLKTKVTVAIGRGENGGRRVTYTNVVRDERRLEWHHNGKPTPHAFSAAALAPTATVDRQAVLLREHPGGRIIAASYL